MYSIQKQQGMTGIGWALIIFLVLIVVLTALKLIPVYLDGFAVSSAVESMKSEHDIGKKSPAVIKSLILKRLDVNMVDSVTKEDIYVDKSRGTMTIEVDYEVRKNLIGNLDVVVTFNPVVQVPTN